jgi:enamine deaminase RidA (YjgF/YER057c/UK114 family)
MFTLLASENPFLYHFFAYQAVTKEPRACWANLSGGPSLQRQRISSGSPYEPRIGISSAVRSGRVISVSGTAPLGPDGKTVGVGDAGAQARRCLEIIQTAIEGLGGRLSDIIRTRVFLTRIQDWEKVALVHGEFFKDVRPASTFVQVVRFIDPEWLVEVEADAMVEE